jgi:hypothetical protein
VHRISLPIAAAVLLSTMLTAGEAPRQTPKAPKTAFTRLKEKHIKATSLKREDLVEFTDELVDTASFVVVPTNHSLRKRLARADEAFRRGQHQTISEEDAVIAVNELADAMHAPGWAHTNLRQIRLFRAALKPHLASLVGVVRPDRPGIGLSARMSPSEVIFVSLYLMSTKMTVPEYQVDPNEWVRRLREARPDLGSPSRTVATAPVNPQVVNPNNSSKLNEFARGVHIGLTDESSEASWRAHLFLDRLGIQK